VLSTPPAFILSQDQTLRQKTKTDTTPTSRKKTRKRCTKFETSQKNQTITHGGEDSPANSTNQ
jgi:hypothetical protein